MRGWLRWMLLILGMVLAGFVAQHIFGGKTVSGKLVSSTPVARIGSGAGAVPVAEDGTILGWLRLAEDVTLPQLPLEAPPKGPRLQGSALEQVRVLAAAPAALRPYLAASRFGESGVDVELSSGIELRFGDAVAAERKWRAVAAMLANPEVSTLDYVDVHAPGRPELGGSGHALPPPP